MGEVGRVLICGAGVVGLATAREFARRGTPTTVIDRVGPAAAASGKAGGFLALDWNDATPLGPLARRSFALHRELADALNADFAYRPVETVMTVGSEGDPPAAGRSAELPWLDGDVLVRGVIGTHETTAQVDPRRLCEALWEDAASRGAEMITGRVERIDGTGPDAAVRGVVVDGALHEAATVVVAMGPWTGRLGLPLPTVSGLKGSSIVLAADAPAQVVFSDVVLHDGRRFSPEVYPRTGGEVYVCGVPSADPLPDSPGDVTVDEADCATLARLAATHSRRLAGAEVTTRQACFRPVTRDGLPLIGPVPGVPGAYVATGHGPWGILNAPATAEMLAEMVLDGAARTTDPRPFRPDRG